MSVQRRSDELVDLLRPDFVGNDGTASPSFVWVCVGAGTAAAPGFRFCADPDTGLYSFGANELGIATGGIHRAHWNATGALVLNDAAASTFMTGPGVTIQQGAFDDEAVALQSTDVAHGMTDFADTDTYFTVSKREATAGGVSLAGYKDADGNPFAAFLGVGHLGENVDTTKTTAGRAIVELVGFIKSGTGIGNTNANGNVFGVRTNRGGAEVTLLLVDEDGEIYLPGTHPGIIINDTAKSTKMTGPGITIQQGGYDDEAFVFQSTDVAHGITTHADTDTYGQVQKVHPTAGGLGITGFKDADGTADSALSLTGMLAENADATKASTSRGIVAVWGYITTGATTMVDANANANIFVIGSRVAVADWRALFIVDEDGDYHYDGADGGAFDNEDDALIAWDLSHVLSRQWHKVVRYNRNKLEELGVVSPGGFVSGKRFNMLSMGAHGQAWQDRQHLWEATSDIRAEIAGLQGRLAVLEPI